MIQSKNLIDVTILVVSKMEGATLMLLLYLNMRRKIENTYHWALMAMEK